jgi:hypothetical protein
MSRITNYNRLNDYIFIVRFNGIVDIHDEASVKNAKRTAIYLTTLGVRFAVVMHDTAKSTINLMSAIFGVSAVNRTNKLQVIPNNSEELSVALNTMKCAGLAVKSARHIVYLDTFTPYVTLANSLGLSAYRVSKFDVREIDELLRKLR